MSYETTVGRQVASSLSASWRQSVSPKQLSSESLARLAPVLMSGGGAALTWFVIRHYQEKLSRVVTKLYREAYVASVVRAAAHEAELERLAQVLIDAKIRSILIKGWSVGRLYPESGLRPSGDIDLWVDPPQYERAKEILAKAATGRQLVDLDHDQLRRFEDCSFGHFYDRSRKARLRSADITVLSPEDQTRFLCLHFLKHGGWRPIWLCDIAVLLESQTTFDWDLCLGKDRRHARWIGCTIALARDLLDARIPNKAPGCATSSPPRWFTSAVLAEWNKASAPNAQRLALLIAAARHRRGELRSILHDRWRNSIQATVDCNASFNSLPRLPFQLWDGVARTRRFVSGLATRGWLART